MTAEIVVMNRLAVALAADSAVTVSAQKTLVSANKVFSLSKHHPVGIMVYGNGLHMGLPWETVLKVYRQELGKKSFASLGEYADHLLSYLPSVAIPYPEEAEERHVDQVVRTHLRGLVSQMVQQWRKDISPSQDIKAQLAAIASEVLKHECEKWEAAAPLENAPDDYSNKLLDKYRGTIGKAVQAALRGIPITSRIRARLPMLAANLFSKSVFVPGMSTGLVVAGFGAEEVVPSMVAFQVQGFVQSVLKYSESHRKDCTRSPMAIIAFAQQDMVHTFMEGIDPGQREAIESHLSSVFAQYPEHIVHDVEAIVPLDDRQRKRLLARVGRASRTLFEDWRRRAEEYREMVHVRPVLRMVAALGKDELATMAETLVSLTSFKRQVSLDIETVGGAIDVAVISKGDGMVWIKRKHYFPPELNHQFFVNYARETKDAQE